MNLYNIFLQQQQLFQTILYAMDEGFVFLDQDLKIVDCNSSICVLLQTQNLKTAYITEFITDASKPVFLKHRKDLIEHKSIEYPITFLNSENVCISCNVKELIIVDKKNQSVGSVLLISHNTQKDEAENELLAAHVRIEELTTERKTLEQTIKKLQDALIELNLSQDSTLYKPKISQKEIIGQNDNIEIAIQNFKIAENNISSIIHCMPDAVMVIDKNGVVVAWNVAMEKLTGIKACDMLGKGNYEYAIPLYGIRKKILVDLVFETDDYLKDNYKNITRDGEIIRAENYIPLLGENGFYFEGTASGLKDPQNNVVGAIEIIRDITARVKANEKIAEQQNQMIAINEELHQTMEELTAQRDILAEKTTMLAETLDQLEKSQHKLVESAKMVALGQLIAGVAHEINTPLGAIRSSISNISETLESVLLNLPNFFKLLDGPDKMNFYILLNRSINAKIAITSKEERTYKRAIISVLTDEQIEKADDYADTLVDMGIYEDIDDLMPFLKSQNSDDVLQMAYKVSGMLRSSKTINIAIDRVSKIVFALKNFSHFNQTGEMVKANINDSLETVLTLYYNQIKQGITLIKRFDEDIPDIKCFPDELNQVWTNLIHNALQAMQNSGTLEVDISKKDSHVIVAITDSGCGIPEEIREKIFMPFFTTKPQGEGSGLGLDIVKRIIEKHNGQIQFESLPGRTTFTVTLPNNYE